MDTPTVTTRGRRKLPLLSLVPVAVACIVYASDTQAFCRTVTCPLPPSWSPARGCLPTSFTDTNGHFWPDFASYCLALVDEAGKPSPAKVLPVWWRNACVSYDIQRNASRQIPYDTAAAVVAAAFAKWTGATCPVESGEATRVSISARDLGPVDCDQVEYNRFAGPNQHVIIFHDDVWPYVNDVNNTLGLTTVTFDSETGEIYDADTEINGTVPLSTDDPPSGFDLASIVTHEMGHFLGLAHSADPSATMWAFHTPGSTSMRTLTNDDVEGLCSIYPPNLVRNVDPSVAAGGSVREDPCDPTPRHGFSAQCAEPPTSGCTVASSDATGRNGSAIVFGALVSIAIARPRLSPRSSSRATRSAATGEVPE
jgi:hypothetical protein